MELIRFTCNACKKECECPPDQLGREIPSCERCGSTVRFRAVVDAVVRVLTDGESLPLPDLSRTSARGIGFSDWYVMAGLLEERANYMNTFYEREPRLDITDPPRGILGSCDFVICSDVLEHVVPPVARGFEGVRALLRPGGILVLTVPWRLRGPTVEHYPNLHRYEIVDLGGPVVVNRTTAGTVEVFDGPVFHGGAGLTLEMRTFSFPDVMRHLERAGFTSIELAPEAPAYGVFGCGAIPHLGIYDDMPGHSVALLARRSE